MLKYDIFVEIFCMEETWKAVEFNDSMQISSCGRFRNKKTGVVWKLQIDRGGYLGVSVWSQIEKRPISVKIHRLVAKAFLPLIPGKDQVNHKDFNKQNNYIDNLEWCNQEENTAHYYTNKFTSKVNKDGVLYIRLNIEKIGPRKIAKELGISEDYVMAIANGTYFGDVHREFIREKKPTYPKPVLQYDIKGSLVREYTSISECERITGFKFSRIQRVISGERRSYKGFIFRSEGYQQRKSVNRWEQFRVKIGV